MTDRELAAKHLEAYADRDPGATHATVPVATLRRCAILLRFGAIRPAPVARPHREPRVLPFRQPTINRNGAA